MRRTNYVLGIVALAAMLFIVGFTASGSTGENQVSDWCEEGVKYEPIATPFIVPDPPDDSVWTLLVLKAGSGEGENETWNDPIPGQSYSHSSGKDNSHAILCFEGSDTSTSSSTSSSSTTSSSTTSSTSSTSSTSTSTTSTSTTTTSSSTTTTTVPEETTTSSTSTTVADSSTTTTMGELPLTGVSLGWVAATATGLLALGLLALGWTRRLQ